MFKRGIPLPIALSFMITGCVQDGARIRPGTIAASQADAELRYASINSEPFSVRAVDISRIDERFLRREVAYRTAEKPGTIVVDVQNRYLYLVQGNGRAMRYGVGVGKTEAFNFRGEAVIGRKARWPHWTPTPDMMAREPSRYGPLKSGLPGGDGNPLGPRALYLYKDGNDTLYRLHGTVEPETIGTKVSSGCVRMLNQDIIDLFDRVPVGAKVVVLPSDPNRM